MTLRPADSPNHFLISSRSLSRPRKLVFGCVLAAVAITLKVRLDTPRGPQPLARAIVTTDLQQFRGETALP